MAKYIDLSHQITDQMSVYPGDKDVKLYQDKFLHKDGYNNFQLEIGMHVGTHIDTPMHLIEDNNFISDLSLDRFIGRGVLLDCRNSDLIDFKDKYNKIVNKGQIVLILTDHSKKFGSAEYYTDHPVITSDMAGFFVEKEIKMLGIDFPSPDKYPFEIHKKLFENNILLLENLNNLSELLNIDDFEITALPLKIKAEAAPARVVAKIPGK
ncbi:MAG: cyclase family protein [Bacillota bacterium]